jgi:peptidoglycan-associated lipoprotein
MNTRLILILAACASLATGCQSTPTDDGGSGRDAGASGSGSVMDDGAQTSGVGDDGGFTGMDLDGGLAGGQADPLLETTVIFFDYDSSEVRSDFNDVLAAHAAYLAANPNVSIRLEGHADERGSREYNIGLGESRAQAVRRILVLQAVDASQITTVSFGEERPAMFGSSEEAWERNRRVEIVYR